MSKYIEAEDRFPGTMIIISSPSGAGKTTITRKLLELYDDIELSVSVTTRKKRPGEVDGKDYFFKLPKVKDKGYQLTVRRALTKTHITVKGSPGMSFENTYLLMHIRGNIIKVVKANPGEEFIYNSLVNDQVSSGIVHVTFFKDRVPLLERLFYNERANDKINIEADVTPNIKKRSKVNFDLSVLDPKGLKSSGSFSVSVQKTSILKIIYG